VHESFDAIKALVALLAIVNPIGNAALFLSLTRDDAPAERSRVAAVSTLAIAVTLTVCVVAGQQILGFFGIQLDDLRVAGGLVVLMIGLSMLHAQQSNVHGGQAETDEGAQEAGAPTASSKSAKLTSLRGTCSSEGPDACRAGTHGAGQPPLSDRPRSRRLRKAGTGDRQDVRSAALRAPGAASRLERPGGAPPPASTERAGSTQPSVHGSSRSATEVSRASAG